MSRLYLGVDVGGTKGDYALCDGEGNLLSRRKTEGGNPNDRGTGVYAAALSETIASVLGDRRADAIFIGGAGCGVGENARRIEEALSGLYPGITVRSDLVNAVRCGLRGQDGVTVIAGTGFCLAVSQNGQIRTLGGYGYFFEEGGSGWSAAREAIMAALDARDGIGEKTVLLPLLEEKLGGDLRDSLTLLYQGGRRFVASLASLVSEGCRRGDAVSLRIIDRQAAYICRVIGAAGRFFPEREFPVAFVGGFSRSPYLRNALRARLKERACLFAKEPPVFGAVLEAVARSGNTMDAAGEARLAKALADEEKQGEKDE